MVRSMSADQPLRRELGVFEAVVMGLGSIIGTGVFLSIGIAAGVAGTAVIPAIALAAAVAACNARSNPAESGKENAPLRKPW
jgi:APA family basic amino acid/polyamine antiporter